MTLSFTALADDLLDRCGQRVDSIYCETFWLPTLGPSALWLLRHIARHIADGNTYTVEPDELRAALGVNTKTLTHTLDRLERFGCAQPVSEGCWQVRTHLGPLPRRHHRNLPSALRDAVPAGR